MKKRFILTTLMVFAMVSAVAVQTGAAKSPKYDINTLAGKVASLNGTAGLNIRFSALIQEEAQIPAVNQQPITTPNSTNPCAIKHAGWNFYSVARCNC